MTVTNQERVTAKNWLVFCRFRLVLECHQITDAVSLFAVQSIALLSTWYCDLCNLGTQLYFWRTRQRNQLKTFKTTKMPQMQHKFNTIHKKDGANTPSQSVF